jgi:hypothetical protein
MSDNSRPTLVEFYTEYLPSRVPTARSKRAKQNIARKYRLPVAYIGNTALIDPQAGDARLAEHAAFQEQPRRGRPRTSL